MTLRVSRAAALAIFATLAGCDRTETVSIGLDPEAFDIVTAPGAPGGSGTVTIDPNLDGGQDYRDNRDKIDEVTLQSLKLEIVAVNSSSPTPNGFPPNAAESMTSGRLVLTDLVTLQSHAYVLDPARLPLAITPTPLPSEWYDLGLLVPDPGDPSPLALNAFLSSILKAGNEFSVVAEASVSTAPVNVTCRLHFAIDLRVSVDLF